CRRFGPMVRVLQRSAGTHRKGLAEPFPNAFASHANRTCNPRDALPGMVAQHDPRPLRFPPWRRPRFPQIPEVLDLPRAQFQVRSLRPARHTISIAANILLWICFVETIY